MKKNLRYAIEGLLVLSTIVFLSGSPSFAISRSADWWSSDSQFCYNVTTEDFDEQVIPIYDTQAQHTQGYETTIGVSREESRSVSMEKSLESQVSVYFVNAAHSAGIKSSSENTVRVNSAFTISTLKPSGRYRVCFVFPRSRAIFTKYRDTMEVLGRPKIVEKAISDIDRYVECRKYSD